MAVHRLLLPILTTLAVACATAPQTPKERTKAAIDTKRYDYVDCYERELAQWKLPREIQLIANFAYGTTGKVTRARIEKRSMSHPPLEACVLRVLQSTQFPAQSAEGEIDVTYPFNFRSKQ